MIIGFNIWYNTILITSLDQKKTTYSTLGTQVQIIKVLTSFDPYDLGTVVDEYEYLGPTAKKETGCILFLANLTLNLDIQLGPPERWKDSGGHLETIDSVQFHGEIPVKLVVKLRNSPGKKCRLEHHS